jgi:hypothetical protein
MNQSLAYLMDEICAGVEIYYTGRLGGQYWKTAFILCDDYTELVSKVFLLTDNPRWTDKKPTGGRANCSAPTCGRAAGHTGTITESFKNYFDVLRDVENIVAGKKPSQLARVKELQAAMVGRRQRRNDFFHSTRLLDLSVISRNCVEAFCDLFEYGEILLKPEWRSSVENTRNLETLEVMLSLEKRSFSDPDITGKINKILQNWPRNNPTSRTRGIHAAEFPEDLHLRLCITCGGKALLSKLRAL